MPLSKREAVIAMIVDVSGVNETMIDGLVRRFYAMVRNDALLGPIFNEKIADWEPHLERMTRFWSSVILMSGAYHGRPMEKHLPLPIDAAHFDRWIHLFDAAADEICPPEAAALFKDRARRIALSLELGRAAHCGVMLRKGGRFTSDHSSITEKIHAS